MAEQYVVAVFFDGTLNLDACGPFRSRARAIKACERINAASEWTEDESVLATTVAQVVTLRSTADLVAEASPA